jgi:hypothetical protein
MLWYRPTVAPFCFGNLTNPAAFVERLQPKGDRVNQPSPVTFWLDDSPHGPGIRRLVEFGLKMGK